APMEAEFGRPQWLFGISTYAFESAERLVCAFAQRGAWRLAEINLRTKQWLPIELPYTEIGGVCAAPGRAVFLAGSPSEAPAVVQLNLGTRGLEVLHQPGQATAVELQPYVSNPEAIEFPTENGLTAHAWFYPPHNPDYA